MPSPWVMLGLAALAAVIIAAVARAFREREALAIYELRRQQLLAERANDENATAADSDPPAGDI